MTSALVAFGQAVRKARLARLWTLELLAHEALGNQERKSYVSAVERGRKALSPLTVQKFAKALDLPEAVVDPLMFAAPAQDEAATPAEENADRLFDELDALRRHLKVSEDQAIALAVEYAKGNPTDLAGALRELQRALEVAAQRTPGSNLDADVADIMAEVDRLNAAGEMTQAGRALQEALERRRERIAEERAAMVALLEKGIEQAVLERSVPDAAACEVEKLKIEVPDPALRFEALRAVWQDWHVRGSDRGLNFDLAVSIALARASHSLARDADQRGAALIDLGNALACLGEREAGNDRLLQAVGAYEAALQERTRDRVPLDWAMTQNNLGNALRILGAREAGTDRLLQAVAACQAALQEWTRDRVPLQWAGTQMNLGIALATLGARETGTDRLLQAVAAYQAALQEWTRERVPLQWAMTQNNLGAAYLALHGRTADPADLDRAQDHALAAREVYGHPDTRADHFLAISDQLRAAIAQRSGGGGEPPPP